MADGCGCGCGALDARLYTHNQRNIEYNFIFTQETRLNYVAQSDIIYIIRYVRWELVFLRIYAQQEMGFCYGYKSLSTKICGRYITVYYGTANVFQLQTPPPSGTTFVSVNEQREKRN